MRGPEQWGVVIFALDNIRIKEQSERHEWGDQSSQGHFLKLTGELTLGVTEPRNRLPTNIWDRQRYAGHLSDGQTRVWWIIHDNDIPGRPGVRWFDVVFAAHIYAVTTAERTRSNQAWLDFVRREWLEYLHDGSLQFNRLLESDSPRSRRLSRLRAALRCVRPQQYLGRARG